MDYRESTDAGSGTGDAPLPLERMPGELSKSKQPPFP
jgi:hypothetical protein